MSAQTATIIDFAERRQARLAQHQQQTVFQPMTAPAVAVTWVPFWFVPLVVPSGWSVG